MGASMQQQNLTLLSGAAEADSRDLKTISNLGLGGEEKRTVPPNVGRLSRTGSAYLHCIAVGYHLHNPFLARDVVLRLTARALEDLVPATRRGCGDLAVGELAEGDGRRELRRAPLAAARVGETW